MSCVNDYNFCRVLLTAWLHNQRLKIPTDSDLVSVVQHVKPGNIVHETEIDDKSRLVHSTEKTEVCFPNFQQVT